MFLEVSPRPQKHIKKHWFAQGFVHAKSAITVLRSPYKTCRLWSFLEARVRGAQDLCENVMYCFKTMLQIDEIRAMMNWGARSILKSIGLRNGSCTRRAYWQYQGMLIQPVVYGEFWRCKYVQSSICVQNAMFFCFKTLLQMQKQPKRVNLYAKSTRNRYVQLCLGALRGRVFPWASDSSTFRWKSRNWCLP